MVQLGEEYFKRFGMYPVLMIEESQVQSESNRTAFFYGIGATALVVISILIVFGVVENQMDEDYNSDTVQLGSTDGVQTEFSGSVLGHHGNIDCDVDVFILLVNETDEVSLADFDCEGNDYEQAEGVNVTWDSNTGLMVAIFDVAPETGSEVNVDFTTETGEFPNSVILGVSVVGLLIAGLLVSVLFTFVKGPQEFAYGVGTGVVIFFALWFVVGFVIMATGCGLMC